MLNFSNPYTQLLPWTNAILFDVCAYRTAKLPSLFANDFGAEINCHVMLVGPRYV